jgi:putative flavoprotein involved in K+ transport
MEDVACAVVGAGPAGLAVSAALAERGIEHVLLERGRAGQTWRTQRWDTFRLNTPGHMNPVLGRQPPDHYARLREVLARLDAAAAVAPVREGVSVRALSPGDAGFVLTTDRGDLHARAVVVATGDQNVPRIPRLASQLPGDVTQVHTGSYRNAAALPEGAVLVVGSGQSGCQIAQDLRAQGREVWLATSPVGRMPARHRGRVTLSALVECGFFDQRPDDLPDPAMMRAPQPVIGAGGHGLSLPSLARDGVHLLGRLTGIDGTRIGHDASALANIAAGEAFAARVRSLLDDAARHRGAPDGQSDGSAEDDEAADLPTLEVPAEIDLADRRISAVVWSTGFAGDFSWLPPAMLDGRGALLHDGNTSALAGVWLAGTKWLVSRSSGILRGMTADAAAIADGVGMALRTGPPGRP